MFEKSYLLPEGFDENCKKFTDIILKYNKVHNITGAKTKDKVFENIKDSVYPISFLDTKKIKTAIDIGTGAGFPGLILAMAMPNTNFILFEPIAKKSSFLHLVKSTFNLQNVDIITKRVEDVEAFEVDLITSRAVTKVDTLLNLCQNFISSNTTLLLYKGSSVEEELEKYKNYEIYNRGNRNYLTIKDLNDF